MYALLTKRIEIPGLKKLSSRVPWMTDFYSIIIHPKRWASLFRGPWSMDKGLYISIGVGVLAPPFVNFFVVRFLPYSKFGLPWSFAPYLFFAVLVVLGGLIYRQTDQVQFRNDRTAVWVTLLAGLMWTLGGLGSVWCFYNHVCMCGHMQHPPYPAWHYCLDFAWALCLVGAAVWTRLLRSSACLPLVTLSSFVLSYRFLFGSFGGTYNWWL
jgi:hypothetical protein